MQPMETMTEVNIILGRDTECALAMLIDNDTHNPKNWAEAMALEGREKWKQGLTKELKSIKA